MENKSLSNIDFIELAKDAYKDKKKLFICTGVAGVLGLIVAFSIPKVYTASVILAPEMSSGGLGMADNLSDMAATFGIDIGGKSQMDAIYPEIYPDVFASTDFVRGLFDVPVRTEEDNNTRTLIQYLRKETKKPFWAYPIGWVSKLLTKEEVIPTGGKKGFVDPFRMSKKDWESCQNIIQTITCVIDKKTSEITISFSAQDPMVAAIMVDTLQIRLQDYITAYRTKKARNDYNFYSKLANESYDKFIRAQREYTSYSDTHNDAILSSVTARQQTLENKMSEAYSTYAGMKKLRNDSKNKIQERTPSFTIIQSSLMPQKPSSMPKIVRLLIFLFLGIVVDVMWVLYEKTFKKKTAIEA